MELVLLGDLFSLSLADELNMVPEDIEGTKFKKIIGGLNCQQLKIRN